MDSTPTTELTTAPALLPLLLRGALLSPLKRPARGAALPPERLRLAGARIDPDRLAAYRRVCGFPATGPLPLAHPHVLAFPLAMRLMTARAFPLPVLGLVHTGIEVTAHHPLTAADSPDLTVYARELVPHHRGTQVVVVTEARLDGALAWESTSRYLARHATASGSGSGPGSPARGAEPAPLPAVAEWRLPGDLGRRYGAVSGDRNPIHLHPLTARAFGFPRAIAHGMWTFARCLAELPGATTVRADFRAPVPLPSTVTYATDGAGAFELRGRDGRVHLTGSTQGQDVSRDARAQDLS
ncbi:MaoC/PaaZ C-terminal domain-containing protein [Streptomyces sp. NPDC001941]|uniref:MaoC family dehydratase n=1 Tax=Streptomyces sp. NPDC001941 TaxID=3154659 RepID=UPI003316BF14